MRAIIVHKNTGLPHKFEVRMSAGDNTPKKMSDTVLDSVYLTLALAIHRAKYLDDLDMPMHTGEPKNETTAARTEAPSTGQAGRSNETQKGEGIV